MDPPLLLRPLVVMDFWNLSPFCLSPFVCACVYVCVCVSASCACVQALPKHLQVC